VESGRSHTGCFEFGAPVEHDANRSTCFLCDSCSGQTPFISSKLGPNASTDIFTVDGDFGYLPTLRQAYVRDVYNIKQSVVEMKATGMSDESLASYAYNARNHLKVKYRSNTPKNVLDEINRRNMQKYGSELGPTIEFLLEKGKTFDDIIESSTRTGGKGLF